MTLKTYRAKRKFNRTPEPTGGKKVHRGHLRFVVQKHDATRLHYDFRLELDGVLKSWAVPKGPSLNPADKRLAVMVEDHPLDYRKFEGVIPEGNYGAGSVIVWDQGTYGVPQTAERAETERLLREELAKGHLSIVLDGQKLKGQFSLFRLKRGKENEWLLLKKRDEWATNDDVTANERSVISDRKLSEIDGKGARPKARRKPRIKPPADAPKSKLPRQVQPMLATLVEKPFDREGWYFEIKWDGYRAIAEVRRSGVALYSRNHKPFETRFAALVRSLSKLDHEAVLDGEIVVVDEQGHPQFQLLQNYQRSGSGRLCYYVFDLLYLDGRDLRGLPLRRRKELLEKLVVGLPDVLISEHVERNGLELFEVAAKAGLEGIVAKNASSPYREGARSFDWLKIKTQKRQEVVIGGFTEPRGSRTDLGALVLGIYEGDDLVYVGHTGGGFDDEGLARMRSLLEPLVQDTCPFRKKPRTNAPVHWVEPRLICEVKFSQWTKDGKMRQPIFLGMREDVEPRNVRREVPVKAALEKGTARAAGKRRRLT